MMTIILLVGWFQFFRRNESGLRFPMRKIWRLRNVRFPTIDPQFYNVNFLCSRHHCALFLRFFSSFIAGLVWLSNSSQLTLSSKVFFYFVIKMQIYHAFCSYQQLQRRFLKEVHFLFRDISAVIIQDSFTSGYFKRNSTFISI